MAAFLRNVWYAAAWADELGDTGVLARTVIGEPLILWMDEGVPNALSDRCPHRWAPLSLGTRTPAGIRCAYHGLTFDRAGRCVENPHGPIVGALEVPAWPAVERHALIWVWLGERDKADPARIPNLDFIDTAPGDAFSKGFLPTAAGHQLLEDNILDLSHADFLHPDTLGGGSITRTRARVEAREDDTVFVEWLARDELALPIWRSELAAPEMPTDMWTSVVWHPSGVMLLHSGVTPAGRDPAEGLDTWNAHIMTPETERSTHYFYCNSRNYRVDDAAYNALFAQGLKTAFATEDKPVIEAQQRRLGDRDLFDASPVLLPTDAASTRARRTYDRLLAAEAAVPLSA